MAMVIYSLDRTIIKIKDSDPVNWGAIAAKGLWFRCQNEIIMVASEADSRVNASLMCLHRYGGNPVMK